MTDQATPRNLRRSCLFYGVILVFVLPAVLIGAAVLFFAARDAAARKQLNARIAELKASGAPVDNASMQKFYEDHTSETDSQAWLGLLEELESEKFKQSVTGVPIFDGQIENEIPGAGQEWPEEAATRAFLDRWQDLHNRTMRLSIDGEPVRFPIKFESIATLLTQTQQMRQAARLLSLRGQLAVYDRDTAAARRSIIALLGCAKVSQGEPILVSQLVSIAIDGIALQVLKRAIEDGILRERDLRDLLELIESETSIGPEWQLAMQGERGMMLPIYENPSMISDFGPNMVSLPFRSRDANHYLDLMDSVLELSTDDMDAFQVGLEKQEAELQRITGGSLLQKLDSILTGLITPALSAAGQAFVRKSVQHRIAALAIGIRLYEAEHGQFPESLDDLSTYGISAQALMPTGGKPFGYRVEQDRAVLWGFDRVSGLTAVPDEPPGIADGDLYVEQNKQWIWELKPVTTPAPRP